MGMIKETGEDKFSASNVTQALTIPGLKAGIYHWLVHLCISKMSSTSCCNSDGHEP